MKKRSSIFGLMCLLVSTLASPAYAEEPSRCLTTETIIDEHTLSELPENWYRFVSDNPENKTAFLFIGTQNDARIFKSTDGTDFYELCLTGSSGRSTESLVTKSFNYYNFQDERKFHIEVSFAGRDPLTPPEDVRVGSNQFNMTDRESVITIHEIPDYRVVQEIFEYNGGYIVVTDLKFRSGNETLQVFIQSDETFRELSITGYEIMRNGGEQVFTTEEGVLHVPSPLAEDEVATWTVQGATEIVKQLEVEDCDFVSAEFAEDMALSCQSAQ